MENNQSIIKIATNIDKIFNNKLHQSKDGLGRFKVTQLILKNENATIFNVSTTVRTNNAKTEQ